MKNKHYNLLLIATYVNFHFWFKANPILQKLIFYGILCFYIFIRQRKLLVWLKKSREQFLYFKIAACIWFILLFVSAFIPLLYGTNDFTFISKKILPMAIRIIEQVFIILLVERYTQEKESLIENYFITSAYSGTLYVLSTVLMLIFPNFRLWWSSIIYQDNTIQSSFSINSTRFGLKGFTGYGQTLYCSMFFIMLMCLASQRIIHHKKINYKIYVLSFFLLLGNVFYGRTGLVVSVIALLFMLMFWLFRYKKFKLGISIVTVVMLLITGIYIGKDMFPILNNIYEWSIKSVAEFLFTGTESSGSIATLQKMHIDVSAKTFLVGDGWYTDPWTQRYYRGTDVGYLREILFYGVFNLLLAYLGFLLESIGVAKALNRLHRPLGTFFSFVVILSIALCEYKGETYSNFVGIMFAIWLASVRDYNIFKRNIHGLYNKKEC